MFGIFKNFFWIPNLGLLILTYFGLLPFIGGNFFRDLFAGELPLDLFFSFAAVVAIPTVATVLKLSNNSKKSTRSLLEFRELSQFQDQKPAQAPRPASKSKIESIDIFQNLPKLNHAKSELIELPKHDFTLEQIFFGIEAPLLILAIARLFWLRELTPGASLIIGIGIIAVCFFAYELFRPQETRYSKTSITLQMIGQSLILLTGLYVGAIAIFYLIPFIFVLGLAGIYGFFFPPLWFFAIIAIIIMAMPYGMAIYYFQSWSRFAIEYDDIFGKSKTLLVTSTAIATCVVLVSVSQIQPQEGVFNLITNPQISRTEKLQKSDQIRAGLLNAYLARYRYPSVDSRNTIVRDFYRSDTLQIIHDFLIAPFIFQGQQVDTDRAATFYANFFDQSILRGELPAIQQAVNATFNRSDAKAGLTSINQKRVLLATQDLQIKSQGDWADVEIHESYQGVTSTQEEIFYAFSLPESAVLTGVWLGDNDQRSQAFPFQVSTRGAAQKVYNAEVQRRVDPALLEQVGPRSYRLRVFPIQSSFDKSRVMNMWLNYKVMGSKEGWALPQLAEKRNLFWSKDTKRIYNGKPFSSDSDNWFPPYIAADQKITPQSHQITFVNGDQITATPIESTKIQPAQFQKIAILLDTSFSMNAKRQKVAESFKWLKAQKSDFDLYLTAAAEKPVLIKGVNNFLNFDLSNITFFGLLRNQQMLQQFSDLLSTLPKETKYDAILMITDQGNYELTDDNAKMVKLSTPLWMVHLDGLPAAYDDPTLAAIQTSGGGVATSVDQAWQRISTKIELVKTDSNLINVVDGYAWSQTKQQDLAPTEANFLPFAARQLIQTASLALGTNVEADQLPKLDYLHSLAKRYNIVTPYSSMIVLVNDQQRAALKKAESESDRFNRTTEDVLPTPSVLIPSITGVPEPSEWLLIAVVAIALSWLQFRNITQAKLDKMP